MADKSILSAFKQAPLFRQIEEEELEHFIENVTIATYKKGHYIFLQGETPDWMLLLLQGTIKVLRQTEMGRFVTFNILTPRQTWGEGIMFNAQPLFVSLQAVEETSVAIIPQSDFVHFATKHPPILINTIIRMRKEYREVAEIASILATCDAEKRVAKMVLLYLSIFGENISLTHQELADMVGTTRETVSRVMVHMRDEEIISPTRGGFQIVNKTRLEHLAR